MNAKMVQVALTEPERTILDIIFNNATPVEIRPGITALRFGMRNGELFATFQAIARTFFDGDVSEARSSVEECVDKLLSAGCVSLIGKRQDAEPPGILQIERPREQIEIVDHLVKEQPEPQQKEEQMAVTGEAVVEFLKQKRQKFIDTDNAELQTLLLAWADEKKKLGERIAAGDSTDDTIYNQLREEIGNKQAEMAGRPLPQAFDAVIRALEQEAEQTTATFPATPSASAPKKTKRTYKRQKPSPTASSNYLLLKALLKDPQFGSGAEWTLNDIDSLSQQEKLGIPRRQISFRLNDLMQAGLVEKRSLTKDEKTQLLAGRLQCAFKLTAKALAMINTRDQ